MKGNKKETVETAAGVLLAAGIFLIGWAVCLWSLRALIVYIGLVCIFFSYCICAAEREWRNEE